MKEIIKYAWLGVKQVAAMVAFIILWLVLEVVCEVVVLYKVLKGICLSIKAVLNGGKTWHEVWEYVENVEEKFKEICRL